jgi:hypothetical protein
VTSANEDVPVCPRCGNTNVTVEECTRIAKDGTRYPSEVATCGECNTYFKVDGEVLTLSSWQEVQRDGTPEQQRAFTEDEKR